MYLLSIFDMAVISFISKFHLSNFFACIVVNVDAFSDQTTTQIEWLFQMFFRKDLSSTLLEYTKINSVTVQDCDGAHNWNIFLIAKEHDPPLNLVFKKSFYITHTNFNLQKNSNLLILYKLYWLWIYTQVLFESWNTMNHITSVSIACKYAVEMIVI